MKKLILLALATVTIAGCERGNRYPIVAISAEWFIEELNDSTLLVIPKNDKSTHPFILPVKSSN